MADRSSTTTPRTVYSDFSIGLTRHPVRKDLVTVTNQNAVAASIRNLILTNKRERLFRPSLGSNIKAMLFEPMTATTALSIKTAITETIKNYEPRANLISVICTPDYNNDRYQVQVVFTTVNVTTPQRLNITLYRVR